MTPPTFNLRRQGGKKGVLSINHARAKHRGVSSEGRDREGSACLHICKPPERKKYDRFQRPNSAKPRSHSGVVKTREKEGAFGKSGVRRKKSAHAAFEKEQEKNLNLRQPSWK